MTGIDFLFNSTGIMLNILGAFFAALAFIKSSSKIIYSQAEARWGVNKDLFESLIEQRNNIILGFVLILVGSAMQFIALGITPSEIKISKESLYFLDLLFFLVFGALLYWIIQKITKNNINKLLIPVELNTYHLIIGDLKKDQNEHDKQSLLKTKDHILSSLSKRLNIKMHEKDGVWESEVLRLATQYQDKINAGSKK